MVMKAVTEVTDFGNNVLNGSLIRIIRNNFSLIIILMYGLLIAIVISVMNGCVMPVTGCSITGRKSMVLILLVRFGVNHIIRKIR